MRLLLLGILNEINTICYNNVNMSEQALGKFTNSTLICLFVNLFISIKINVLQNYINTMRIYARRRFFGHMKYTVPEN
jgi:hypothetical protein